MTSEDKLADVQRQCDAIWEQRKELPIECPYCFTKVEPGEPPCCSLLDKAVRAVIERAKAVDEGLKSYERREFGRMIMGR